MVRCPASSKDFVLFLFLDTFQIQWPSPWRSFGALRQWRFWTNKGLLSFSSFYSWLGLLDWCWTRSPLSWGMRSLPSQRSTWALPAEGRPGPSFRQNPALQTQMTRTYSSNSSLRTSLGCTNIWSTWSRLLCGWSRGTWGDRREGRGGWIPGGEKMITRTFHIGLILK